MGKALLALKNGIIDENPTFIQVIGTCPTLAVTTSAINGIGMGLSTMAVLVCSNLFISLLRKIIPDSVRIPCFIVVIASFVTIVQLLLSAFMPALNESLGLYIPLIVVNCIILGRAEGFASKNGPLESFFDGIGNGIGFTLALCFIGLVREFLGAGTLFGATVMPEAFPKTLIMIMAPGAFFTYATLMAIFRNFMNKANAKKAAKEKAAA
ncbi:Electron transport complex subunit RnfE [bioreactor metagenome]|uniref:Electron transport complex subunit RnfE n=1 Tax=bioreactor metagenome TaxID=1076179 RepID=A0A645BZC0_9ZZZZ|nr:electron transport complex subunit E [Candidatus Metalachnospira sp.]